MLKIRKRKRVVIAISGGVDSATSAFLLQKEGYEVIGVFMRLGIDKYTDEMSARRACQELGIRFYPVNLENIFKDKVVKYFIDSYSSGITPNPCVRCNKLIKFGELFRVANSFDAYLATGHYVRVKHDSGNYRLFKAKDKSKDQSYFLYNLGQNELKRLIFPLSTSKKTDIQEFAKKMNISHNPSESQDICFLNIGGVIMDHNDYLKKHLKLKPGIIKTISGETVGKHKGLPLYTIGQRRGVEIGGVGPFYVVKMDYDTNTLYVTNNFNDDNLFKNELQVKNISWVSGAEPDFPFSADAVIRYHHPGAECTIEKNDKKEFVVKFKEKQRAVTSGQSVVFYVGDEVIGGGIIN